MVSAYPAIKASAELTAERFFSTESPEKVVTSVATLDEKTDLPL